MNKVVHRAESRGFANHGWLQANHSFSFANYHDPKKVHFGALRVLNDDLIAPSMGFSTHPHENMEIITIPLKGELKHKDSMHSEWQSVVPNEVQVMSAGTGIYHSEINGSNTDYLSLFQIWIIPDKDNVDPRYDQKQFVEAERKNNLQKLVTSFEDNHQESLKVHQDIVISRIHMDENTSFQYDLKSDNQGVYVMNISGTVSLLDEILESRDAIGISNTNRFEFISNSDSDLLFIEVPMIRAL